MFHDGNANDNNCSMELDKDEIRKALEDAPTNWMVIMSDSLFKSLSKELRDLFSVTKAIRDDHVILKEDQTYLAFYKSYKKAQKALEDYKWRKRYGD